MNNEAITVGPITVRINEWGNDSLKWYSIDLTITTVVSFRAHLSTAPSGIYLNLSLSGDEILKRLNKPK